MAEAQITCRALATVVGALIIAAATNATILQTGGYLTAQAPLVASLAAGVFAGARVMPRAWGQSPLLATAIFVALLAGESYNLVTTGERLVITREAAQVPLREAAKQNKTAVKHLENLQTSEPSSVRLTLAKAALAETKTAASEGLRVRMARKDLQKAKKDAFEEGKDGGCRKECLRKQGLVDKAQTVLDHALADQSREADVRVAQAQAELQAALADAARSHEAEIAGARADVERYPAPPSASPLSDRLGCEHWILDLVLAGLLSIGANGLAGALVAFGASGLDAPASGLGDTADAQFQQRGSTALEPARVSAVVPQQNSASVAPLEPEPRKRRRNRKPRSELQKRANLIAKEMRDRGEVPEFHIVRSEFRNRFGTDLPKVTAHRACK